MWFNLVMNNHDDGAFVNMYQVIKYMREALSLCGHEVTVSWSELYDEAVNLYFERFDQVGEAGWARRLGELRQRRNFRVGVVATELMLNGTIPYASRGITYDGKADSSGVRLKARMDGFHAVLKEVDFVWAFLERTAGEYRERVRMCEFFPVGCVEIVDAKKRRAPRDLDIVFFGKATPHRATVIESLAASGLKVLPVGEGWQMGYCPPTLLESLLDRAKIGLNLTLHAAEDTINGIDPRFASCMRVVEMLSRNVLIVSETIPLDNPYRGYMCEELPRKLPDLCRFLLDKDRWKAAAEVRTETFRTQMDVVRVCKPVIDRTLAGLRA